MRSVLTLLTAVMLGACSMQLSTVSSLETAKRDAYNVIVLDQENGMSLTLPANPWQESTVIDVTQQVKAKWNDPQAQSGQGHATFIARIAIDPGHVKIAVIDDLGRRALDIDWTENALDITTADWVSGMVDGRRLLADMVMTYWPLGVVQVALAPGLSIAEARGERVIRKQGNDMVFMRITRPEQDPWQGIAIVHNTSLDYELGINSKRMMP
jgi:hypothetical protein